MSFIQPSTLPHPFRFQVSALSPAFPSLPPFSLNHSQFPIPNSLLSLELAVDLEFRYPPLMKTTLELPDSLLQAAIAVAARDGLPLGDFVAEAIQLKLSSASDPAAKPWLKHFGSLRHLHAETESLNKLITDEFENVDPCDWR